MQNRPGKSNTLCRIAAVRTGEPNVVNQIVHPRRASFSLVVSAVVQYVQDLIQRELPNCKIFPVGSFPLKTYLPCADVDMVMFIPRSTSISLGNTRRNLAGNLGAGIQLEKGEGTHESRVVIGNHPVEGLAEVASAVPTPALVTVNQALCMVASQNGPSRGSTPQGRSSPHCDEDAKPEIRNVSFINARTPIVTMVAGNIVADLTENQGGSVAASVLLEEADRLIQRGHLFKRSLLLLKAWAFCETPRLVGQRVLGARNGGLTSYGLSVMVLHLFAVRSLADNLLQPLDVLVRFFEVYAEFDWGQFCLTLDGAVAFDDIRQNRPRGGSKSEGTKSSRLWPLVDKVLAPFCPVVEKEKVGRVRGRRASRFERRSGGNGGPSRIAPHFRGVENLPAMAHFPVRICNIQDPLNALNNLGHSMSKRSLKALEHALQLGRQQLRAFNISSGISTVFSSRHHEGFPFRRSEMDFCEVARSREVGDRPKERVPLSEGGGGDDRQARGEEAKLFLPPHTAPPLVELVNPPVPLPHHFAPPIQYAQLIPPMQGPYIGMFGRGSQPIMVPPAHAWPTREGQPINLSFRPQFLQAIPHHYQLVYHPYFRQQLRPELQQPYSTMMPSVMASTPGAQAHPEVMQQWDLQRFMPRAFQSDVHPGYDQQFAGVDTAVSPAQRDQAPAHVWIRGNANANGSEPKARPKSASWPGERIGRRSWSSGPARLPNGNKKAEKHAADQEDRRGCRRKRLEEHHPHGQPLLNPMSWDVRAFISASPTSSTASISDFAEDLNGKDDQANGEENEGPTKEELQRSSVFDAADKGDATLNRRHQEHWEGQGTGIERAEGASTVGDGAYDDTSNGNLWSNRFLREFFPHCCRLYASGNGYREDLLDHPCQRWSKLQKRGPPSPRQPGSRDILVGDSEGMWGALEAVGQITLGGVPLAGKGKVGEALSGTKNAEVAIGVDGIIPRVQREPGKQETYIVPINTVATAVNGEERGSHRGDSTRDAPGEDFSCPNSSNVKSSSDRQQRNGGNVNKSAIERRVSTIFW